MTCSKVFLQSVLMSFLFTTLWETKLSCDFDVMYQEFTAQEVFCFLFYLTYFFRMPSIILLVHWPVCVFMKQQATCFWILFKATMKLLA